MRDSLNGKSGFSITSSKGFHLIFDNGITLSVQFGAGNYCDNYENEFIFPYPSSESCENAEIAIYNKNGWLTRNIISNQGDDVIGYVNSKQLVHIIKRIPTFYKVKRFRKIDLDKIK